MSVRWEPPWISVTWERARAAMVRSEVGVMIWSPLLMKYHDGIDFQAACVAGVSNAAVEAVRWAAHNRFAVSAGRSLPKLWTKMSSFRYRSDVPADVPGSLSNSSDSGLCLRTESAPDSDPLVSPTSGAAAST